MRVALISTVGLTWSLWLGATISVFVFVSHFFAVFSHEQAADSANAMFHAFAHYELVLAAITVIESSVLLICYPTKSSVLLLGTTILASSMVITVALGLMPAMDSLRAQGRHDEYMKLHGKSMIAMVMQSGILLIEGAVLLASLGIGNNPAKALPIPSAHRAIGRSTLETIPKTAQV